MIVGNQIFCIDDELAGCPDCGSYDEIINVHREHYAVCRAHGMKWHVGSNLFSGWRDEDDSTWEANAKLLAGYREAGRLLPVGVRSIDPQARKAELAAIGERSPEAIREAERDATARLKAALLTPDALRIAEQDAPALRAALDHLFPALKAVDADDATAARLADALAIVNAFKAAARRRADDGKPEADRAFMLARTASEALAGLIGCLK